MWVDSLLSSENLLLSVSLGTSFLYGRLVPCNWKLDNITEMLVLNRHWSHRHGQEQHASFSCFYSNLNIKQMACWDSSSSGLDLPSARTGMPGEVADGTDFVVTAHEGPDREPDKILYNFEAKAN